MTWRRAALRLRLQKHFGEAMQHDSRRGRSWSMGFVRSTRTKGQNVQLVAECRASRPSEMSGRQKAS